VANETIAVFTKNRSNPAYDAARLGAERTAARYGARVVHYVPRKPDDIAEQIALVEQAIATRPDAVVFVPVHLIELDASVRKLNAAGIPVVNYLNRLARGQFVSYVGSDDYRLARDIATYLFRYMGGKGDVLLMEGVPGAVTSRERVRGFLDAVKEWPGMRIVATRSGQFLEHAGREAMKGILAEGIRFDGVLSANDAMSLGALSALEAAGIRVPVIGVNALPDAIESVKTGRLLATVDFDALKIACIATEAALRHLRGETVPAEIILPVQVVDRENYQPWDRTLEERKCPRWEEVAGTREL
jgi:ribose transport system substrate-binding protein